MHSFHFQTVPQIISGVGSIQELSRCCSEQHATQILIVTDPGMIQLQLHQPVLDLLNQLNLDYQIFSQVQADPSAALIEQAVSFAKSIQADLVIGFGGGSAMDVAKVVALLSHPAQTQNLPDLYGIDQARGPRLPLILIPTTAGTGAEVTPIAIVTTGASTKSGIVSKSLYADVAILDAQFSQNLPAHITAATGIDAMVHAIEAYTSKQLKNIYSDMLAKNALQGLNQYLPRVLAQGSDLNARQEMLFAAMLAGQAFANAPVSAVHALAYPLGGHFHLSHGHSNALVLIEVLKFNAPAAKHLYAELMQWLDPRSSGSVDGLCDLFIDHMHAHLRHSGLVLSLRDLGIAEHMLSTLASDAMLQTRLLQNNPRELHYQDALQIYQAIY